MELDNLDRSILRIVQNDNQLSHSNIGQQVGLSTSAVRRRLQLLRENEVIQRDVSILDRAKLGITIIVTITFGDETVETYDQFDALVHNTVEITQSYHVAGTDDYVIIIFAKSLEWYEDWGKQVLMSNPAIKRYDSRVVWSCKKFETALPV